MTRPAFALCLAAAVLLGAAAGLLIPSYWWLPVPPACTVVLPHSDAGIPPPADVSYDGATGFWLYDDPAVSHPYGWSAQEDTTIYQGVCAR